MRCKRRRIPPTDTVTQAAGRNHPVLCKMEPFTALCTTSCRETAHGRMVLPSVFPIISHFWKVTLHLQFLGYRKGLMQDVLQHDVQMDIDG